MEAVLKKAYSFAKSKNIDLLVLIQPSVIDLTKNNAVLSYEYLRKYAKYGRRGFTDIVKDICLSNGIHLVLTVKADD